jgi:hypothetical protein
MSSVLLHNSQKLNPNQKNELTITRTKRNALS